MRRSVCPKHCIIVPSTPARQRTMPVRRCIRCAGLGRSPVSGRRRRPSARSSSPSEKVTDSLRAFTSSMTVVSSSATFGLSQQDRLAKYATGVITLLKRPALSSRHPNNGRLRSNPRYSDDADSARRSRMLQRRPQRLQTNQTCPPTTEKCWTSVASQDGQRCSSNSGGRSGPVMVIAQGGTAAGPLLCYATHTSRLQNVPGGVGISLKSARARMARGLARAVLSVGTALRWTHNPSVSRLNLAPACSASRRITGSRNADIAILVIQ
jgi:hypothetical protein